MAMDGEPPKGIRCVNGRAPVRGAEVQPGSLGRCLGGAGL